MKASDENLCVSSGPDRKLGEALAAGGPVIRESCCGSSLPAIRAPAGLDAAAAREQTLGVQVLCLIG